MKKLFVVAGLALALASCGLIKTPNTPGVTDVQFPASIAATGALTVTVTVGVGCASFDGFSAQRTAGSLTLTTRGSIPVGVACSGLVTKTKIYTDAGTPTWTNPFEVIVNGKSYGNVTIK